MNDDYNLDDWFVLHEHLNNKRKGRTFQEREVWWCSVGLNIGTEIYGKSATFSRPVLVIKKFNRLRFLGAPLTSQCDKRDYRYPISFKGKEGRVIFDQVRIFDSRRLLNQEVQISEKQFEKIKAAFKQVI